MTRTRRSVLGAVGGAILVAGCVGDGGDDTADSDSDTAGDTEDTDTGSDETTETEGDDTEETDDNDSAEDTDDESGDDDTDEEAETATVQVHDHETHGEILVGPDGLTLYMFDSDEQGAGASTCQDGCAENWPPLTVEDEPVAGENVAGELTTFEREDGTMQVAINGWPLYYFANDEAEGNATGQGANDVWWVLDPSGTPIRGDGSDDGGDDNGDSDDDDDSGPGY